jgi:hypothetical protein
LILDVSRENSKSSGGITIQGTWLACQQWIQNWPTNQIRIKSLDSDASGLFEIGNMIWNQKFELKSPVKLKSSTLEYHGFRCHHCREYAYEMSSRPNLEYHNLLAGGRRQQ